MSAKTIHLHEKARAGIVKGATLVAEAARVTLGPKGRNVMIQSSFGAPLVTKDGVTVVKEIDLEDKFENMGAKMIREVAQKTSDVAGDGTTTATVLARAMLREGIKLLAAGMRADGAQARNGRGGGKAAEVDQGDGAADQGSRADGAGRDDRGQRRQDDRQDHRGRDGEGREGRRDHGRGGDAAWRPRSTWSRACVLIAATSRRTS